MNEVLEKGKGAEDAAVVDEPKRTWDTLEALQEAVRTDEKVRDDYLANQAEYKVNTPEAGGEPPQGDEPAKPQAEPEVKPEAKPKAEGEPEKPAAKKVTLEVTDDLLGSYATGRATGPAILEALKGNKEKDKTILFLKNEKLPSIQTELANANNVANDLRKAMADLEKKKAEPAPAPRAKLERPEIPDVEIGDEDDITDEANQKKIRAALKGLKGLTTYIGKLEERVETLQDGGGAQPSKPVEPTPEPEPTPTASSQASPEFDEIDAFAVANVAKIGKARPFKVMQERANSPTM